MADEPARYDSPPEPNDKYYVIAQQRPETGLTWDFIAGPYDSQDAAMSNKVYAVREYSARRNHPEWLEGADVSVVHTPMQIPTGLGAIEAAERRGEQRQDARPEAGKALPSPAAIADERDGAPTPEGANMADKPAEYNSPPESIELARKLMREIKEALTTDAQGRFSAKYSEVAWDGINMQPPDTAWQEMDAGDRYDLLLSALDEAIWSLEPSEKWNEPRDSEKLALEFVKEEERQLHAEMRHDYGLRFLDDRGVKYEDATEHLFDHAGEVGNGQERQGPRLPFPGEIVRDATSGLDVESIGGRGEDDLPSRRQRLSPVGEGQRRAMAAFSAQVTEITQEFPGGDAEIADAWRARTDLERLDILADQAVVSRVDEEVFVRTARRVLGWPDPTAEQRDWMSDAWVRADTRAIFREPFPSPGDLGEDDRDGPEPRGPERGSERGR
jgi:hypothetical protein